MNDLIDKYKNKVADFILKPMLSNISCNIVMWICIIASCIYPLWYFINYKKINKP